MGLEFSESKQIRARKNHKCWLCGNNILPHREYIYISQKYNGEFQSFRLHIHCDAMLDAWKREFCADYEYDADEVAEDLREYVCSEICNEEQMEECTETDAFSCELCQKKILGPVMLEAAKESVRENCVWEDEE